MKAAVYYGVEDVRIEEIPKPKPNKGEVLMKVKAATTCGTDVKRYKRGYPLDKGEPIIFGHEGAGIVEAIGEGVTKFAVGDRITSHNTYPCQSCYYCKRGQYSMCDNLKKRKGTFAEYVILPEKLVSLNVFHLPDSVSYAEGAMIEPLSCALYGVEEANIRMGDYVVINGAGPLGLYMVRLAYLKGAKVIVCDLNQERLNLAKELGAWQIIHVTNLLNQVEAVKKLTPRQRGADVVIEAVGLPEIWELSLQMVRKGGLVEWFGGCKAGTKVEIDTKLMHYSQLTLKGIFHTTPFYVETAFELIKMGEFKEKDFITKAYPLEKCIEAIESHYKQEAIKNVIVFG